MTQESSFIEVLGESSYIERPEKFPVEMEITLRAPKDEKHRLLEQFSELESSAFKLLSEYREELEKLVDGGRRITSYRDRRTTETIVSRKFLLQFDRMEILNRFWEHVLEFNSTDSQLITFEPSQPFFSATVGHEQAAHGQAIIKAKEKALNLAQVSGLTLGSLISSKQLALRERHSGAYSDEDWWGDSDRFRPHYHIGGAAQIDLEEPERVVFVRYLVRYEVKST